MGRLLTCTSCNLPFLRSSTLKQLVTQCVYQELLDERVTLRAFVSAGSCRDRGLVSPDTVRGLRRIEIIPLRTGCRGEGTDKQGAPAASVPHHEDHSAIRLPAHPPLQHARRQVSA